MSNVKGGFSWVDEKNTKKQMRSINLGGITNDLFLINAETHSKCIT